MWMLGKERILGADVEPAQVWPTVHPKCQLSPGDGGRQSQPWAPAKVVENRTWHNLIVVCVVLDYEGKGRHTNSTYIVNGPFNASQSIKKFCG